MSELSVGAVEHHCPVCRHGGGTLQPAVGLGSKSSKSIDKTEVHFKSLQCATPPCAFLPRNATLPACPRPPARKSSAPAQTPVACRAARIFRLACLGPRRRPGAQPGQSLDTLAKHGEPVSRSRPAGLFNFPFVSNCIDQVICWKSAVFGHRR